MCRIRMNAFSHLRKSDTIVHALSHLANQISSGAANNCATQHHICSFFYMNLRDSISLSFTDSSVTSILKLSESIKFHTFCFQFMAILSNMSDLRFSIGGPWDQNLSLINTSKEESISDNRASMHIGVMSKLILRAAVSNSKYVFVC